MEAAPVFLLFGFGHMRHRIPHQRQRMAVVTMHWQAQEITQMVINELEAGNGPRSCKYHHIRILWMRKARNVADHVSCTTAAFIQPAK